MHTSTRRSLGLIVLVLSLNLLPAFAGTNQACSLVGTFGYVYNGTSFASAGPVPLTETGVITVDPGGTFSGEGTLAFQFSNFGGPGPLWLLLREVQSSGVVTRDPNNECAGVVNFVATGTVIKSSNPALVPEGVVLFNNTDRSIAYTISGPKNDIVDVISTSPGTIASGTAHRQDKNK
jgi:hypothetical protein